MKVNYSDTQSVYAQARFLMRTSRQKLQNREQSMLNRAATQVGIGA